MKGKLKQWVVVGIVSFVVGWGVSWTATYVYLNNKMLKKLVNIFEGDLSDKLIIIYEEVLGGEDE
tara:strand:- start:6170 stop:6364 length:195 start_codon:yes stop_codon:yes gene_type:complete